MAGEGVREMNIRTATKKDMGALLALYETLFASAAALQPDYYRAAKGSRSYITATLEAEDSDLLVAEDESGAIAGFACVKEEHTALYDAIVPLKYGMLWDLAVDEKYRRQGMGAALLAAAKAWAKARGLAYMELQVLAENDGARALYKKEGFATARHIMRSKL